MVHVRSDSAVRLCAQSLGEDATKPLQGLRGLSAGVLLPHGSIRCE